MRAVYGCKFVVVGFLCCSPVALEYMGMSLRPQPDGRPDGRYASPCCQNSRTHRSTTPCRAGGTDALRKRDDQLPSTFHLEDAPATIEGIGLRAPVMAARAAGMTAELGPPDTDVAAWWYPEQSPEGAPAAQARPCCAQFVFYFGDEVEGHASQRARENKALRAELEKLKVDKRGCNSAGLCICGRMGLDSLHKRFIAESITRYCPPHSTGRSRLIHGEIVGERSAARREFMLLPKAAYFLGKERVQRDGEESEPEGIP